MTVSELLEKFDQYNSSSDTAEIVTIDSDFGGLLTLEILSIENLLTESEFTDFRIKPVKRWWLKQQFTGDLHQGPWSIVTTIVIQI